MPEEPVVSRRIDVYRSFAMMIETFPNQENAS